MDSVILYLPSPEERNRQYKCFEENLCARAFKVIHDKQKGPLVFFRVYSGKLVKGQKIYNTHQDSTEQTGRLLVAYADDFQEVEQVTNGNIAVLTGLKVLLFFIFFDHTRPSLFTENYYRRFSNEFSFNILECQKVFD